MSDRKSYDPPSLILQQELIEQIGARLPENVRSGWVELVFTHRRLSMYAQGAISVSFADGTSGSAPPPRGVADLAQELRELMYREGTGTWFSATWTIRRESDGSRGVSASFNYDEEPEWTKVVHPGLYGLDLEDFPRSEENIPGWLGSLLAEAEETEAKKRAKAKNGGK